MCTRVISLFRSFNVLVLMTVLFLEDLYESMFECVGFGVSANTVVRVGACVGVCFVCAYVRTTKVQ